MASDKKQGALRFFEKFNRLSCLVRRSGGGLRRGSVIINRDGPGTPDAVLSNVLGTVAGMSHNREMFFTHFACVLSSAI